MVDGSGSHLAGVPTPAIQRRDTGSFAILKGAEAPGSTRSGPRTSPMGIPMAKGFLYLVAIMDWHSRPVVEALQHHGHQLLRGGVGGSPG